MKSNYNSILVTGGCGFIGSHFIKEFLKKNQEIKIFNLDKLTYAGRIENLKEIENNPNYQFIKGDILDKKIVEKLMKEADAVIHFAAESHVDRSIENPISFMETDFLGTGLLLEEARKADLKKFVYISTDEVYGDVNECSSTEKD